MPFWRKKPDIQVNETTLAEFFAAFVQLRDSTHDNTRTHAKQLAELREDMDALAAKYERLRGRVYGAGLHRDGPERGPETREQTKARVLASRFTPGRPAIHSE